MENLSKPADNSSETQNVGSTELSSTSETYTPENVQLLRSMDNRSSNSTSLTQDDSQNDEQSSITNPNNAQDLLPNLEITDDPEAEGNPATEGKAPKSYGAQTEQNAATTADPDDDGQSQNVKQNVRDANLAATLDDTSGDKPQNEARTNDSPKDKPDAMDIQKHIDNLAADKFKTRNEAQKALEDMGSDSLPALEKAKKESKDPEVKRRAEFAIKTIEARNEIANTKDFLDKANKSEPAIDNLLDKAGVSVSYDKNPPLIAGANGAVFETARFQQLMGQPKGQLSDADKKSAEEVIKMSDSLRNNEKFAQAKRSVENKTGPDAEKDAEKINKLALMAEDGRQLYARALSNSDNPADQQRGIELLTEAINNNKGQEPGYSTTESAARLGADKDQKFKEVFKKAGGDVNELEEKAERYREYKRAKKQ